MKTRAKIALPLVSLLLVATGCSSVSQNFTAEHEASGIDPSGAAGAGEAAVRADGEVSGDNPENPFPVIKKIIEYLWVEIDWRASRPDGEVQKTKKYFWVGQGFISDTKIAEGEDCGENHIKILSGCPSYDKVLTLRGQSPTLKDTYQDHREGREAYLMEVNFRGEKLVLDNENPDIIFLLNKTMSDKFAEGGKLFDIFILEDKQEELDQPNQERGTISGINAEGKRVSAGLTIRQLLEDCGQVSRETIGPDMIGLIQQGAPTEDPEELARLMGEQTVVPKVITLKSLKNKSDDLKAISSNGGRSDLIDKLLADDDLLGSNWFLAGNVRSDDPHGAFGAAERIGLGTLVDSFGVINRAGSNYLDSTLSFTKANEQFSNQTSFVTLKAQYDGETKFYLYRPSLAKPAKIKMSPQESTAGSIAIHSFEVEQEPIMLNRDPWCGFTPECKPAIYLYPPSKSFITVKIGPSEGQRLITIPRYDPKEGWRIIATPWGIIHWGGWRFTHLFYESLTRIPAAPKEGWVISQESFEAQLERIGKLVGLNNLESREMASYWRGKLPDAPHYFVGIIDESEIERLEPIEILPRPDSILRVRLLFQPLDRPIEAQPPAPAIFPRRGFTVVEWGGYISL